MKPIAILSLSSYAFHLLQAYQVGEIHSIYNKTVNLALGPTLLALQTKESPLGPTSLITSLSSADFSAMSWPKEGKINVFLPHIHLNGQPNCLILTLQEAMVIPCHITPSKKAWQEQTLCLLGQILEESHTGGMDQFFLPQPSKPSSLVFSYIQQILQNACGYFLQKDYEKSAHTFHQLVGLGIGLTPSGDDFLCGMMAGLALLGEEQHPFAIVLKEGLPSLLSKTHPVSASYLRAGFSMAFSDALIHLFNTPSLEQVKEKFLAIGHSSGMDSLCGVYVCLSLFQGKYPFISH